MRPLLTLLPAAAALLATTVPELAWAAPAADPVADAAAQEAAGLVNTFDPSIIDGPREIRLAAYRQVRDQLMTRVKHRFPADLKPNV